jgi:hypothetical protein
MNALRWLLLSCVGCGFHERGGVGPEYGGHGRGTGAAANLQATIGGVEGSSAFGVTAALAANVDHEASGVSALFGFELAHMPFPYGVRAAVMLGPRFESDVIEDTTIEFRGSLGFEYGFDRTADEREVSVRTLGVELFVSQVGVAEGDLFGGIAVIFGRYVSQPPGVMADL